jgi:glycosyltransferase involved in cell wall biosynthesis
VYGITEGVSFCGLIPYLKQVASHISPQSRSNYKKRLLGGFMYKVIHIISDKNIGGAGVLLLNLLRHSDRTRFAPILVLPKDSLLLPRAKALDVPCVALARGGDKTFSPSALLPLIRLFLREKPDLIHTNASLSARLASLPFRAVKIDTKHCCFPPTARQKSAPARLLFRAFEALSGVFYIATAEAVRDNLARRGSSLGRLAVIPGGAERMTPLDESEKRALRASLGIPDRAFVVGYCARVERGKGHETFLEAARLLAEERDILFLAVGGGSLLPDFESATKALPNVKFLGFREDVARVMNLFDLSLNCSYLSETSPLSLSEGMSLGKPIVVTDVGGNAAMAKGCGIVVPPRNGRALAAAIQRLKNDRARYAALSTAAQRRYAALYSAARMTQKTEAFYLSLLNPNTN